MSKIFYVSDLHFGHFNILRYDNRPFANTHEMEDVITKHWNSRVRPDDTVYILGDVSWIKDGATYRLENDPDFEIWLCNVTKYVFGEFPKNIYIYL